MQTSEAGLLTERGFTLLELLVTLSVVALLSAAAVALGGGDRRNLQRETIAVTELLGTGRRLAKASGTVQKIEIGSGSIRLADDGPVVSFKGSARFRLLHRNVLRVPSAAVYFFPDGSSTGGTIEIAASGGIRVIEIDSLGRVDVRSQ